MTSTETASSTWPFETAGIEGIIIGSVEVLNSNGKGAFSVGSTNFPEDVGLASLGGGDFNGNGRVGIAAYGYGLQGIFTTYNLGNNNFSSGPTLELPNQPYSFCVGDFNGDHYSDFAVLDGNQVDVYLNQRNGTYSEPATYNVGANPFFIACRALRPGGRIDLITANHDSNDVSVLLGKVDGTFAPAVNYPAGTHAEAITTGDFNRDGKIDLAVGGKQQIAILRGRGDGTFETATFSPAPGPVTYLTEVDLRGTGIEDLISVNTDFNDFAIPDNIFLLSGKGDGTFTSPLAIGAGADPYWVTAGDFNNDGTSPPPTGATTPSTPTSPVPSPSKSTDRRTDPLTNTFGQVPSLAESESHASESIYYLEQSFRLHMLSAR
jgi:hypothetical protein